jgi:Rrf2 family protein
MATLSFSRTTDYALIALAFLSERSGIWSSRGISVETGLPASLLAKILKTLQQQGWVASTRGVNGGYQLSADLQKISLLHLVTVLESVEPCTCPEVGEYPSAPPLVALKSRLHQFLTDVKLSDLVLAGRRIDVPFEAVGIGSKYKTPAPVATGEVATTSNQGVLT